MQTTLRRATRRLALSATVLVPLFGVGLSGPASASHIGCGSVITASTTLDSDIGPCSGDGLVVVGSNLKLDLNGHRIFGTSGPEASLDTGVGLFLNGASSVVVRNGTISDFDGGVVIVNGAGNKLSGLSVLNNVPTELSDSIYSDGISIEGPRADNNQIVESTITGNGPFAGISAYGGGAADMITGTVIRGNRVQDNVGGGQTAGILLENWTWSTTISRNTITGNAFDGVSLFADIQSTSISGNEVRDNGFRSVTSTGRKGDGIRVASRTANNVVEKNAVTGNAGNGIFLLAGSTPNQVLGNQTGANGVPPTVSAPNAALSYDLRDGHPTCAANIWSANTFDTANPVCTTG